MKLRDAIMDVWKWIAIEDCDKIQSTVVTIWLAVPWLRFLDHVKGRCPFVDGRADNAKLHYELKFGLSIPLLLGIKSTILPEGCWATRFNVMHDVVWWRLTCSSQICEIGKLA